MQSPEANLPLIEAVRRRQGTGRRQGRHSRRSQPRLRRAGSPAFDKAAAKVAYAKASALRAALSARITRSSQPEQIVAAQDGGGVTVHTIEELRCGREQTHWMWFVFPQIAGLGQSAMSEGRRSAVRR